MRVLDGRYRLLRPLASGGMGTVWLGEHVQLGTPIAVKLMSAELISSASSRARFEREARAAAQLRSPYVVAVHDCGVDEGTPYIVMERLEGEDLSTRLRRDGAMAPARAAIVVEAIARALERAHGAGIVHRDLKPANIFLARQEEREIPKVLDFGVAKERTGDAGGLDELTSTTDSMLGSPSYMSPEQIRNAKSVDHRADLWSMGVVAHRLLTNELPFRGDGKGDLLVRICTEPAPPIRELRRDLPEQIDAFFTRALAKEPRDRFASAREVATAFRDALGLPPDDQPPSLPLVRPRSPFPFGRTRTEAPIVVVADPPPPPIDLDALATVELPAAASAPAGPPTNVDPEVAAFAAAEALTTEMPAGPIHSMTPGPTTEAGTLTDVGTHATPIHRRARPSGVIVAAASAAVVVVALLAVSLGGGSDAPAPGGASAPPSSAPVPAPVAATEAAPTPTTTPDVEPAEDTAAPEPSTSASVDGTPARRPPASRPTRGATPRAPAGGGPRPPPTSNRLPLGL